MRRLGHGLINPHRATLSAECGRASPEPARQAGVARRQPSASSSGRGARASYTPAPPLPENANKWPSTRHTGRIRGRRGEATLLATPGASNQAPGARLGGRFSTRSGRSCARPLRKLLLPSGHLTSATRISSGGWEAVVRSYPGDLDKNSLRADREEFPIKSGNLDLDRAVSTVVESSREDNTIGG